MSRCRICNAYVDIYEWPSDKRELFVPNLCYDCFVKEQERKEQEEEEIDSFDQNTEYCMPEVKIDPEEDDAPDLGADDNDNTELEESTDDGTDDGERESMSPSPEMESIQNLRRSLFG